MGVALAERQNPHVGNSGVLHAIEIRAHPRSLCHGNRPSPSRRGGRSFRHRPLSIPASSPAHRNVSINHHVDAVPPLFPRFHARILPAAVTGEILHFCRIHREFRMITLSCRGETCITARRSRWCPARHTWLRASTVGWFYPQAHSRKLTSKSCNRLLHNWAIRTRQDAERGRVALRAGERHEMWSACDRPNSLKGLGGSREARTDDR